eukprot:6127804-Pleurochrysis_carterae.AAC.1
MRRDHSPNGSYVTALSARYTVKPSAEGCSSKSAAHPPPAFTSFLPFFRSGCARDWQPGCVRRRRGPHRARQRRLRPHGLALRHVGAGATHTVHACRIDACLRQRAFACMHGRSPYVRPFTYLLETYQRFC